MNVRAHQSEPQKTPVLVDITQGQRLWRAQSCGVGGQLVAYMPGREMPRHSHRTANITVILAGAVEEEIDGRDYVCGPLCVVVKPAGTVHATRVGDAGTRSLVVEVDAALEDGLRRRYGLFDECRWFHEPCGLASCVIGMCGAMRESDSNTSAATEHWFARLGEAMAVAPRDRSGRSLGTHLHRAVEIMRREQSISTRELASRLGLHAVYLARLFRQRLGCTPRQARRGLRLEAAVGRIVRTDEPLALLALRAGFADQSHMAREIKRRAGVPAGVLRRLGSGK
jgi:AraC-like DNA-binding protein/quercetin dioxygenase-like cupin family protein